MDFYKLLFWIGFITLIVSHLALLKTMQTHSILMLIAASMMFVGSKLGREFLGIA
jgi:hypothetical protein